MSSRRLPVNQRRWWLGVLCVAAALLIRPVQDRIDKSLHRPAIDPDLLYFSSPPMVKALALGYDSLLADIYWMRAIQYYGRREAAARRQVPYKNLSALFDIVTTLDPKMLEVYRAGSVFLGEPEPIGAGQPGEAIRLLDKGILSQPQEWRLRFEKGFVCYWYLKDYKQAGQEWLGASRVAGAPPWVEGLAARGFSQGGAIETARDLWRRQLEGSTRADLRENAKNHLASIQVDEDLWTLEFFLEKYAVTHGGPPPKLENLVAAGFLKYIPVDPSSAPYQYEPLTGKVSLSAQSKVRYLALSYDYQRVFKDRLARIYDVNRR